MTVSSPAPPSRPTFRLPEVPTRKVSSPVPPARSSKPGEGIPVSEDSVAGPPVAPIAAPEATAVRRAVAVAGRLPAARVAGPCEEIGAGRAVDPRRDGAAAGEDEGVDRGAADEPLDAREVGRL